MKVFAEFQDNWETNVIHTRNLNNFENVFECSRMGTSFTVRCLNGAMAGTQKALFINQVR